MRPVASWICRFLPSGSQVSHVTALDQLHELQTGSDSHAAQGCDDEQVWHLQTVFWKLVQWARSAVSFLPLLRS